MKRNQPFRRASAEAGNRAQRPGGAQARRIKKGGYERGNQIAKLRGIISHTIVCASLAGESGLVEGAMALCTSKLPLAPATHCHTRLHG